METTLPQNVVDARSASQNAMGVLGQFNSKGFTIEDELKRTVQEALNYNKDLIDMRSTQLADYIAAPANANVRYGVQQFSTGDKAGQENPDFVWNPFERNKLIQGAIGQAMIPFSTTNTLLGMREGQVGDLVNAGTRAFQASQAAAQAQAAQAQQYYSDVLGEFTTMQDIAYRQAQINQEQQRIELAKLEAAKKGAGDNSGASMMNALLEFLNKDEKAAVAPQQPGSEYVVEIDPFNSFTGLQQLYGGYKPYTPTPEQTEVQKKFQESVAGGGNKSLFIDFSRK